MRRNDDVLSNRGGGRNPGRGVDRIDQFKSLLFEQLSILLPYARIADRHDGVPQLLPPEFRQNIGRAKDRQSPHHLPRAVGGRIDKSDRLTLSLGAENIEHDSPLSARSADDHFHPPIL